MKTRKCKNCKDQFTPYNSLQKYCSKSECIRVFVDWQLKKDTGMKINIQLPIEETYTDFVKKNKHLKNIVGVYRIKFEDDLFYIGRTSNFAGRVYNHCTISDLNKVDKPTRKHLRMINAIEKHESVTIELISFNDEDEHRILKSTIESRYSLNMKL